MTKKDVKEILKGLFIIALIWVFIHPVTTIAEQKWFLKTNEVDHIEVLIWRDDKYLLEENYYTEEEKESFLQKIGNLSTVRTRCAIHLVDLVEEGHSNIMLYTYDNRTVKYVTGDSYFIYITEKQNDQNIYYYLFSSDF